MENQSFPKIKDPQQLINTSFDQKPVPNQKMNVLWTIIITFFISAFIFGIGGFYLGQHVETDKQVSNYQHDQRTSAVIPTPSTTNPSEIPVFQDPTTNWETYNGNGFLLKHPKDLKFDTEAVGAGFESIRFRYMGPKQIASGRTQTSLFDGYSFIVTKIGLDDEKTPEQWATENRGNSIENCGSEVILSDVKQITMITANGVQYSVKNCIGDYTISYLSNGSNVFEVTQAYAGEADDQKAYEEITSQIFNTLKFL